MRFFDAHAYTADQAWDAIAITTIDDATVRLHWTDQPYTWHINDGPEVFVVLDGAVDMHYRHAGGEHIERLTPGRICYADCGCKALESALTGSCKRSTVPAATTPPRHHQGGRR